MDAYCFSDEIAHIKHPWEIDEMRLSDLTDLIDDALEGRLDDVTEKLDGQNYTFTVRMGEVRFLGKGVIKSLASQGGLDRDGLMNRYADKPDVQRAFVEAYDALQCAVNALRHDGVVELFFRGGDVALNSELLTPLNPNVVRYPENSIRFISPAYVTDDEEVKRSSSIFFEQLCLSLGRTQVPQWTLGSVPALKPAPRDDALAEELKDQLETIRFYYGTSRSETLGDLRMRAVRQKLQSQDEFGDVCRDTLESAARRLALKDKASFSKAMFPSLWQKMQELESKRTKYVTEACVPIEKFFMELGDAAIESYTGYLAPPDDDRVNELLTQSAELLDAFDEGNVSASPKRMNELKNAVKRMGDPWSCFKHNVEGIVFSWQGQRLKLTGHFTPINRLLSIFRYGSDKARVD